MFGWDTFKTLLRLADRVNRLADRVDVVETVQNDLSEEWGSTLDKLNRLVARWTKREQRELSTRLADPSDNGRDNGAGQHPRASEKAALLAAISEGRLK